MKMNPVFTKDQINKTINTHKCACTGCLNLQGHDYELRGLQLGP